jgi:hypothetical protein
MSPMLPLPKSLSRKNSGIWKLLLVCVVQVAQLRLAALTLVEVTLHLRAAEDDRDRAHRVQDLGLAWPW